MDALANLFHTSLQRAKPSMFNIGFGSLQAMPLRLKRLKSSIRYTHHIDEEDGVSVAASHVQLKLMAFYTQLLSALTHAFNPPPRLRYITTGVIRWVPV